MPPRLFFKKNPSTVTVYDSRSGRVIEHPVGGIGRRVLEHLKRPGSISDLRAALSHVSDIDLDREVSLLKARGLVFQEDGRFLSLVLPEAPTCNTILDIN